MLDYQDNITLSNSKIDKNNVYKKSFDKNNYIRLITYIKEHHSCLCKNNYMRLITVTDYREFREEDPENRVID